MLKHFSIQTVHRGEMAHIGQKNRGLYDVFYRGASFSQYGLDIGQRLASLCLYTFGQIAAGGNKTKLTGCKQKFASLDGLGVGPNGSRSLGSANDFSFSHEKFVKETYESPINQALLRGAALGD